MRRKREDRKTSHSYHTAITPQGHVHRTHTFWKLKSTGFGTAGSQGLKRCYKTYSLAVKLLLAACVQLCECISAWTSDSLVAVVLYFFMCLGCVGCEGGRPARQRNCLCDNLRLRLKRLDVACRLFRHGGCRRGLSGGTPQAVSPLFTSASLAWRPLSLPDGRCFLSVFHLLQRN